MSTNATYGSKQARIQLPAIVANAHAGVTSIITRHGKPYAAVVPLQDFHKLHAAEVAPGLLALRGTGRGLWGSHAGQTIAEWRDEWGDA